MNHVTVKRSDSGNWIVRNDDERVCVYPPYSWRYAFTKAWEYATIRGVRS